MALVVQVVLLDLVLLYFLLSGPLGISPKLLSDDISSCSSMFGMSSVIHSGVIRIECASGASARSGSGSSLRSDFSSVILSFLVVGSLGAFDSLNLVFLFQSLSAGHVRSASF